MAGLLSWAAVALAAAQTAPGTPAGTPPDGERLRRAEGFAESLEWTGQDSLRFAFGGVTVVVDPLVGPSGSDRADFILITHPHQDHLSPASVEAWSGAETAVIAPVSVVPEIRKFHEGPIEGLKPGDTFKLGDATLEAVPAYNAKKQNFHPKANGWLGYVLDDGKLRVYIAGDTERIPEMREIRADSILLPLGQVYTMNDVAEAVACVADVHAVLAIPVHWGQYEGSAEDVRRFGELLGSKARLFVPNRKKTF